MKGLSFDSKIRKGRALRENDLDQFPNLRYIPSPSVYCQSSSDLFFKRLFTFVKVLLESSSLLPKKKPNLERIMLQLEETLITSRKISHEIKDSF